MSPYSLRFLLSNSAGVLMAAGAVPLKALWDAHLIERSEPESFVAFSLLFPIIITVNTFGVAFANAVSSTFIGWQWQRDGRIDLVTLLRVVLAAVIVGALVAVLLLSVVPWLCMLLNATAHEELIRSFMVASLVWLPLQFLSVAVQSLARGLGLFKRAGVVAFGSYAFAMFLSWLLIIGWPPGNFSVLELVAFSNAAAAGLFNIGMLAVLASRNRFFVDSVAPGFGGMAARMMRVGGHGLVANMFALVFIYAVMSSFAAQEAEYVAATGYLFRLEQLVLTVFFVMSAVIVPHVANQIRNGAPDRGMQTIRLATRHFIVVGISSLTLVLVLFISMSDELILDERVREIAVSAVWIWFPAYLLQGLCLLYAQLLTVVFDAAAASMISILRFILIGTPVVLIVVEHWGIDGLMLALPGLHVVSLAVVAVVFTRAIKKHAERTGRAVDAGAAN
ncbi:MAG: hypothetical protein M3Q42_06280 [Pseudomonadota bacterium]|nr:hypothetical protein [Pseudomonadota bacterium]